MCQFSAQTSCVFKCVFVNVSSLCFGFCLPKNVRLKMLKSTRNAQTTDQERFIPICMNFMFHSSHPSLHVFVDNLQKVQASQRLHSDALSLEKNNNTALVRKASLRKLRSAVHSRQQLDAQQITSKEYMLLRHNMSPRPKTVTRVTYYAAMPA